MKHEIISEIARTAGMSVKTVHHYCSGRRRPAFETADHLEKTTGIDKLIWLEGDLEKSRNVIESSSSLDN